MRALILDAEKCTAVVGSVPVPEPSDGEILVNVSSVALNPVDALYVSNPLGKTGRIVGSDFSGTVTATKSSRLKLGQRVAGFLQGACSVNDRPGAFAEYLIVPADLAWLVPETMSDEEAATISLCALTAAQAVFYRLGLQAPFGWGGPTPGPIAELDKPGTPAEQTPEIAESFFIYGSSTSVGLYAAQLVRQSAAVSKHPIKLVGAASPRHHDMLRAKPYGYDALVDYRHETWPEQIRELSRGSGVDYAYDCISEGATVRQVASTLRKDGKMAIVRSREGSAWSVNGLRDDVEPIYGAVWEGLGVDIQYQNLLVPASPEARAFAVAFYEWLSGRQVLHGNPVRLMPGGLEKIQQDGFALLGPGSMDDRETARTEPWMRPVSAEKLVYRI